MFFKKSKKEEPAPKAEPVPAVSFQPRAPRKYQPKPEAASQPSLKIHPAPAVAVQQPRANAAVAAVEITHEAISQRAKEIWEKKGRPVGQDDQNWREAEAELRAAAKK